MSAVESYGSSPTRRSRRTADDMKKIRAELFRVLLVHKPMTVRQVYYQMVSRGVIDKTETEYKSTVCRLLSDMRREGVIPYGWITDNTRLMRKPRTHSSLADALDDMQTFYRRAIWDDQDAYVEVWLEKDALSGVLYPVTSKWDVPLMVTRGYPSLSFLHDAAETIDSWERPAYLYYFGDHDPSGVDIPRAVEEGIREMAPEAEIHFERVAVNRSQIEEWSLPTRPTKKTDTRSKNFEGESVEVDAIEPGRLRRMVENCITQHIDSDALDRLQTAERAEKDTLKAISAGASGRS